MKSKNKSPFSRFLALMLAFVMTFTMMPATASAAGQSSSREGTGGGTEDPMHYEKTTTLGDDGTYTIRMETYATGTVTTSKRPSAELSAALRMRLVISSLRLGLMTTIFNSFPPFK